jgi:3-hydroxyacyl-CoA dehydrogenase/enoyl-CoA hydratase/3-hydroxybutyryl-CoA epimerase
MNRLITRTIKDTTAILTLDRPESSANVIDLEFFKELNEQFDWIEEQEEIRSIIFLSNKPGIFIAGADLNQFKKGLCEEEIHELISTGHQTFSRLNLLDKISVAAIHGICVGGGLELSLACDYRIASDDRATKIGLPEVNLGILPGWGGSSRLPRMIGLRKALHVILSGKQFNSSSALNIGVIDGIVKKEKLLAAALKQTKKGKHTYPLFPLENHPIITSIVEHQARKSILSKTNEHYPAPLKALKVAVKGLRGTLSESYKLEEKAFMELITDPVSMNLVNLFFLTERSKRTAIRDSSQPPQPIKNAAVIGAGVMGSGIAQWIASRKYPVMLKDIAPEAVGKGMAHIQKVLNDGVKRKTFTKVEARDVLDRVTPVCEDVPMKQQDLIIEAVIEKLDLKQKVMLDLESRCREDTVIATNTSALSISRIATVMKHPERMVGIHFFNPVHRMKLIEIIQGDKTNNQTLTTTLEFVKKIGKLPVLVKDSPGFLVNRILMPYLFEAVRLFDMGYSHHEIDKPLLKFGMPMGPLRLIDEVGVDVAQHVASDLLERLTNPFPESQLLVKMIEKKLLGKKGGHGFYHYDGKKHLDNVDLFDYRVSNEKEDADAEKLTRMMVYLMINEGARCIEESVVHSPEDVDFGMVMGTGWAPFRGGPMRYADHVGVKTIVRQMENMVTESTPHFKPCNLLIEIASKDDKFYPDQSTIAKHTPTHNSHQDAA